MYCNHVPNTEIYAELDNICNINFVGVHTGCNLYSNISPFILDPKEIIIFLIIV